MAAAPTTVTDKTRAALTKAITSAKPFTRAELAARFDVEPRQVSDVVARLKHTGWQVETTRTAFQGPLTYVVTPAPPATPAGGAPPAATEAPPAPTAPAATAGPQPRRRRARAATAGEAETHTRLPALGEPFEVVLLARNPDGSTTVGLRSAISGEIQMTWPSGGPHGADVPSPPRSPAT